MSEHPPYLVALTLTDQPCLVVGGGEIATGKIRSLVACGARVTVVAPEATERVRALAADEQVTWVAREYEAADLDGTFLVVAATDDGALHHRVHADATARNMLINVVDVPDLCTFTVPAIHREGPVTVAVSTSGASPALAKRLRDEIAAHTRGAFGRLAELLRDERAWSRTALETYADRQRFFESIVLGDPDPIELLANGEEEGVRQIIAGRKASGRGVSGEGT